MLIQRQEGVPRPEVDLFMVRMKIGNKISAGCDVASR